MSNNNNAQFHMQHSAQPVINNAGTLEQDNAAGSGGQAMNLAPCGDVMLQMDGPQEEFVPISLEARAHFLGSAALAPTSAPAVPIVPSAPEASVASVASAVPSEAELLSELEGIEDGAAASTQAAVSQEDAKENIYNNNDITYNSQQPYYAMNNSFAAAGAAPGAVAAAAGRPASTRRASTITPSVGSIGRMGSMGSGGIGGADGVSTGRRHSMSCMASMAGLVDTGYGHTYFSRRGSRSLQAAQAGTGVNSSGGNTEQRGRTVQKGSSAGERKEI